MSEYQYYEFAAIERPLTQVQMARLRAVSSRAEITPAGFVNHYEWGDLKADPADWMARYFDAFVYTANWGTCWLSLRLPVDALARSRLKPFAAGSALSFRATKKHWILDWALDQGQDLDRCGLDDGSRWMGRLAPLRDELLRGDLGALYLGWLAAAGRGELDDADLEPEVPPGLATLSRAQRALVEFLEIDTDLLAAAAGASSARSRRRAPPTGKGLDAWLESWSRDEMVAVLESIARGDAQAAEREVRARHVAWTKSRQATVRASVASRTFGQLTRATCIAAASSPTRASASS
jgi:hypothetical protein